jgi:hypothetical protein
MNRRRPPTPYERFLAGNSEGPLQGGPPVASFSGFSIVTTRSDFDTATRENSRGHDYTGTCFRYFELKDRHFYESGSIRLSSLHAMARREDLGPLWDHMEGAEGVIVSGVHGKGHDPMIDKVINPGRGTVAYRDVGIFERVADCWILSLTDTAAGQINPDKYQAGIRLRDVTAFATALQRASNGALGDPVIKKVEYRNRKRQAGTLRGEPESAFIKGMDFETEREVRIAWPRLGTVSGDGYLDLQLTDALEQYDFLV